MVGMSESSLGAASSFLCSVTWAVGVSAYSNLARKYPPSAVNMTRGLVALPAYVIWAMFLGGSVAGTIALYEQITATHLTWLAISMVSSFAVGDLMFLLSCRAMGVPGALALSSAYPIWSALADTIFRGAHLSTANWVGLVTVVVGIAVVILVGKSQIERKEIDAAAVKPHRILDHYGFGVALGLGTSLFWALNTYATARGGEGLPMAITNSYRMLFAVILCPLVGMLVARASPRPIPMKALKPVLWVFILESVGGSTLYMYGLTHAPLAIASALSALAPAISAPIAWVLKMEKFSAAKFSGILMIIFGIWMLLN